MSAALNRDQFDQLVRAIADGRRMPEADVRAAIDEGPLLPDEALRHGLVDDLAYEDELDDLVQEVGRPGELHLLESDDYANVTWESLGVRRRSKIAVLNAVGAITSGRGGYDPVDGAVLGSDSLVEYIREIRADASIRAIVLRIDSPGGSSTASDVIWRELMITKGDPHKRPIIVSMSDLAASGGYYVAMAGDVIVAQPGTLTGSIGIYTGKFVTGGTFDKLGRESSTSPAPAVTPRSTRRIAASLPTSAHKMQESMQAFYDQFVEKVAEARHTSPEKIDQIAQGRVWTGQQARQVGLVDQLGGLQLAVEHRQAARAHSRRTKKWSSWSFPPRRSLYEVLSEQFEQPSERGASAAEALLVARSARATVRVLRALLAPSRLFRSGEILAHMPYVFLR